MSAWFRPIAQCGPARPEGALALAGSWCWFTHAERIERRGGSEIVPATEIPDGLRARLCAPRPPLAGLGLDIPRIMGIVNATPDSFSDGGLHAAPEAAAAHARRLLAEGADLLDIGGESTRPGAAEVPEEEEIARTRPVIAALAGTEGEAAAPVSIDTRKARVAEAALAAGARIVNDVSALGFDPRMAPTVARSGAFLCLMHSRGTPETMQRLTGYDDVLLDVYDALEARIAAAEAAGIARARIVVDPGIGFAKTEAQNLALLARLELFHGLGCPILLGASRKRFIGSIGDEPEATRRVAGSLGVALAALAKGVQIVRVHDVGATWQAMRLWWAASGLPGRLPARPLRMGGKR